MNLSCDHTVYESRVKDWQAENFQLSRDFSLAQSLLLMWPTQVAICLSSCLPVWACVSIHPSLHLDLSLPFKPQQLKTSLPFISDLVPDLPATSSQELHQFSRFCCGYLDPGCQGKWERAFASKTAALCEFNATNKLLALWEGANMSPMFLIWHIQDNVHLPRNLFMK